MSIPAAVGDLMVRGWARSARSIANNSGDGHRLPIHRNPCVPTLVPSVWPQPALVPLRQLKCSLNFFRGVPSGSFATERTPVFYGPSLMGLAQRSRMKWLAATRNRTYSGNSHWGLHTGVSGQAQRGGENTRWAALSYPLFVCSEAPGGEAEGLVFFAMGRGAKRLGLPSHDQRSRHCASLCAHRRECCRRLDSVRMPCRWRNATLRSSRRDPHQRSRRTYCS